jgi:hypothetical protein
MDTADIDRAVFMQRDAALLMGTLTDADGAPISSPSMTDYRPALDRGNELGSRLAFAKLAALVEADSMQAPTG